MKIEKTKINGYDVFIHKTTKYSSIHMRFLFEMPYTREGIFKYDLLEEYQIHSSMKYKTRKELSEKRMELYSLSYGMNNYNLGEKMFTEATFNFYDPELVGDDYLRDGLEFAHEILFNPNFEDGHLDTVELDRCKMNITSNIEDGLMDFRSRAGKHFIESLFPNTYKTRDSIASKEEYEEIIAGFSDEDLISAHEYLVQHCLVGLVIMGNIKDEHLKYIEDLFKFEETHEIDDDYREIIPMREDLAEVYHKTDADYGESIVRAVYECPASNLKEKLAYNVINRMIGSSGMLIHKTLREEQGIVYSAGSAHNRKLDYMVMLAYIDASNYEAALEGFETVLKKLEDRNTLETLLAKVKEEVELNEYTFDESKWNVFYELYDTSFNFYETQEERNDIYRALTCEDIEEALNKMKRITVHFYEGVKK